MSNNGIFLIALSVGVLGFQCNRDEPSVLDHEENLHGESSPATDIVHLSIKAQERVGIDVWEVETRECRSVLKAMGKVLAPQPQTAIVSHAFPARVAEVPIQIGDWVEQGDPVITLESHEVGGAMSEFYKAIADFELAELNFEREKRLSENGIGIEKNLLAAEAEQKVAQASREAAEKRLHVLGFTEEDVEKIEEEHLINPSITLYAAIAGKVVDIQAVLGAMVDPSTQQMTIIDPRLLWVDAEIYEKDLAKVKIGMFANVDIKLGEACRMLAIPLAAILEQRDQKIVFVQEEDHFVRREVETGPVDGDYQQILEGLTVGEKVVIEGNHQLNSELHQEVLKAADVH